MVTGSWRTPPAGAVSKPAQWLRGRCGEVAGLRWVVSLLDLKFLTNSSFFFAAKETGKPQQTTAKHSHWRAGNAEAARSGARRRPARETPEPAPAPLGTGSPAACGNVWGELKRGDYVGRTQGN